MGSGWRASSGGRSRSYRSFLATGYSHAAQNANVDFPILRKPYQMHELSRALGDLTSAERRGCIAASVASCTAANRLPPDPSTMPRCRHRARFLSMYRNLCGEAPEPHKDAMKFHFFHLMPYPDLPDGLPRTLPLGLGRCARRELFDPAVGHRAYNDYLDELEYADQRRLRRHLRQRAPPERLRPDAVAQPDGGGAGAAHLAA